MLSGRVWTSRYTAVEEEAIRKCLEAVQKQGERRVHEVTMDCPGRASRRGFAKFCEAMRQYRLLRHCEPKDVSTGLVRRKLNQTTSYAHESTTELASFSGLTCFRCSHLESGLRCGWGGKHHWHILTPSKALRRAYPS